MSQPKDASSVLTDVEELACGSRSSELYIYYKVTPEQRSRAALAVGQLLSLCRGLGVTARLMHRRDVADDGSETWMEVYGDVPDDFEAKLEKLVRQAGLTGMTSERRSEWFVAFRR